MSEENNLRRVGLTDAKGQEEGETPAKELWVKVPYPAPTQTLNDCPSAFEKWLESKDRLPLEDRFSGDIATAFNAGWIAAKQREIRVNDDTAVSRDLVAKIRAAQFRYFESKNVPFTDSDLLSREEAQFIAREIGPIERESSELMSSLKALGPFELVQGDVIKRTQPHSGQVVNTNGAWAVSSACERAAHKVRKHIEVINNHIEGGS